MHPYKHVSKSIHALKHKLAEENQLVKIRNKFKIRKVENLDDIR